MFNKLSADELKQLIKEAIDKTQSFLNNLIKKNNDEDTKKATLLGYWIKNYIKYLSIEKTFKPQSLINYRKGRIVLADFGFRLGNEIGGKHYAIIIEKKNSKLSGIVTVIPLTSLKPSFSDNKYEFQLKTGLFQLAADKVNQEASEIKQEIDELNQEREVKLTQFQDSIITLEEYKKFEDYKNKRIKEWNIKIAIMMRHLKQLESLKYDTVVNVSQITTISKMRIITPKSNNDLLSGLKLSDEDINELKAYLKKLYLF